MTKQEPEAKLNQLGLKIPSNEIDEMEKAMKHVDQMVESVRKLDQKTVKRSA